MVKSKLKKAINRALLLRGPRRPVARRSRTGRRRQRRQYSKTGADSVRSLALAVSNPFDYFACIPDGAKNKGCFTTKQFVQLSTGAGSCCGFIWQPDTANAYFVDSGSALALPTLPAASNWIAATANPTIILAYASERPVACGLKCRYVGPTNTDGGTVIAAQFDHAVFASQLNGASLTFLANLAINYKIFPLREGVDIFMQPCDKEQMDTFVQTNFATHTLGTLNRDDWLGVFVFGAAASTACLAIEAITQYEGTFVQQNLLVGKEQSASIPMAQEGWYEKMQNALTYVEPIKAGINYLGSMANGLKSAGLLDRGKSLQPPAERSYYGDNLPIDY